MRTLLKNGRILDPSQDLDIVGNLLIEMDQVVEYGPNVSAEDVEEVYDCTGMWITPGLVDPHVHLREPGQKIEKRSSPAPRQRLRAAIRRSAACRIRIRPSTRLP